MEEFARRVSLQFTRPQKIEKDNEPHKKKKSHLRRSFSSSNRDHGRAGSHVAVERKGHDHLALLRKKMPVVQAWVHLRLLGGLKNALMLGDKYYAEVRGNMILFFESEDHDFSFANGPDPKMVACITDVNVKKEKDNVIRLKRFNTTYSVKFGDKNECSQWEKVLHDLSIKRTVRLRDFEIISVIGFGASGCVFLAKDKVEGKMVALKSIDKRKAVFESPSSFRHAIDERLSMELVQSHPYVASMLYAFQTKAKLYLVLQIYHEGDLFNYLQYKQIPFDEPDARNVIVEIIVALEKLHSLGILYRDLKPENVLLDSKGHVKLADFGLSKIFDGGSHLGRTSTICGTHSYVAPEMLSTETQYGFSVDIWTLGIFYYHIVVGKPPLEAATLEDIKKNYTNEKIIFYDEIMSPDCIDFLRAVLTMDDTKRLGCGAKGISEIKSHPFFKDVDWNDVEHEVYKRKGLFDKTKNPSQFPTDDEPPDLDDKDEDYGDECLWPVYNIEKRPLPSTYVGGYSYYGPN